MVNICSEEGTLVKDQTLGIPVYLALLTQAAAQLIVVAAQVLFGIQYGNF